MTKQETLAAVAQNGLALQYASTELRADPETVRIAVAQNGLALQYASTELRADPETVRIAVAQYGHALQYASAELPGLSISYPMGRRSACARHFEGTVQTGCFVGTVTEFLGRVYGTHADNEHAQAYRLWIAQVTTITE